MCKRKSCRTATVGRGDTGCHLLHSNQALLTNDRSRIIHTALVLQQQGIRWSVLPYHKRPSLAGYPLRQAMTERVRSSISATGASTCYTHVRTYLWLWLARATEYPLKLIFDIRGLMAEEYVDSGIWKERSLPFRLSSTGATGIAAPIRLWC